MRYSETDPQSYITEYGLVHEDTPRVVKGPDFDNLSRENIQVKAPFVMCRGWSSISAGKRVWHIQGQSSPEFCPGLLG